jgi:transcriptional regulator with XRE-family HTH domain
VAKKRESVEGGLIDQLQQAIRDSGLSLNKLAEQAGLTDSQLSRFMRNERALSLTSAEKVCQVLHGRLVFGSPTQAPPPAKPKGPRKKT